MLHFFSVGDVCDYDYKSFPGANNINNYKGYYFCPTSSNNSLKFKCSNAVPVHCLKHLKDLKHYHCFGFYFLTFARKEKERSRFTNKTC